jgi:hypothetical protein
LFLSFRAARFKRAALEISQLDWDYHRLHIALTGMITGFDECESVRNNDPLLAGAP